jgi:hypothetical protein
MIKEAIDDMTQQRGTPLMDQLILMKHDIDVMKHELPELPRRTVHILQSMKRQRERELQQNEQHAVDT